MKWWQAAGRTAPRILFAALLALWAGGASAQEADPLDPLGLGPGPGGSAGAAPAAGGGALELDCLIEPKRKVIVAAPVIGVVEEVFVERGDSVKKGQPLAALESDLEKANVEVAQARADADAEKRGSQARLDFETRRLARNTKLYEEGVVSDLEIDEIESARLLAEASLMQSTENQGLAALELVRAEAALRMRSIESPVDGVVVDVILNPGEYADPPQIVELAQIDPLRVEVFAPVSALGRIDVGSTAKVIPEEPVGGAYEAQVTVVDRVVDAASGTFGVRLELPNPDYALSAGLKCRVRF